MLTITIPEVELYNEATGEFVNLKSQTLALEHSLVSLYKWEAKWMKPFLGKEDKTRAESIDYIRCMTLTQNVNPEVYDRITDQILNQVTEYIAKPMTATTITSNNGKKSREIMTAEVIYSYMFALNIPFECRKWHLNQLMMLITVCGEKNSPSKNMSSNDVLKQNAKLNAMRRKAMNTRG